MHHTFFVKGHPNITANHKNTLEFIKGDELSKDGDCIVGVSADFKPAELKSLVKTYNLLKLKIKAGRLEQSFFFNSNSEFDSKDELVIRRSDFNSERTLGIRSDKTSRDIDRRIVKYLQNPKHKAKIIIEPKIKLFIFDFDDTLEDYTRCFDSANRAIARYVAENHNFSENVAFQVLKDIDRYFSLEGVSSSPKFFDRHRWFKEFSERTRLKFSKQEIERLVDVYWVEIRNSAKIMPHARDLLDFLYGKYFLAVMSDSDGAFSIKEDRIKKVGLYDYFDVIMTSDVTRQNKPSKKFYKRILKKIKVSPAECVMVGDKPEVDLRLAKELGMVTVHVNHGVWSAYNPDAKFGFVDYRVDDLKELIDIVRDNF